MLLFLHNDYIYLIFHIETNILKDEQVAVKEKAFQGMEVEVVKALEKVVAVEAYQVDNMEEEVMALVASD